MFIRKGQRLGRGPWWQVLVRRTRKGQVVICFSQILQR